MTRWLIIWCVFVAGLIGSVSSSNAAKCSVVFLNTCSNQQVCYRSTKNKGSASRQYVFEELIESAKSQEDKLATARVIADKDSQKTANAIKSLMSKK